MTTSLDEIWKGDLLKRREDAQMLQDFLVRRHAERKEDGDRGAYVVNLNAGWGHGKTYFMERFRKQLEATGHPTAFVNAWRDDSSKEPVVAVMAAIETALKPYFAKEDAARKIWNAAKANSATIVATLAKGAARQLIKKGVGEGIEELEALLANEDLVSEDVENLLDDAAKSAADATTEQVTTLLTAYVDQKLKDYQARIASSATFQHRMNQLLAQIDDKAGVKMPFFVLIDELDRCRPTYAIEMLEQVKHLFDIENTIFVIATDGDQLSHSIRAVYGEGFDGKKYLLRFFQRHYKFEKRDLTDFVSYLFTRYKIDRSKLHTPHREDPVKLFVGAMQAYSVTLRDAEQCFDILRSMITTWDYKAQIELSLMLPLIIKYQRHNAEAVTAYIEDRKPADEDKHNWTITVQTASDGFRPGPLQAVSVHQLNRALIDQAHQPLDSVLDYGGGSPTADYAKEVLNREIQTVHNGHIQRGMISKITQYPRIVRQVSRLAAPRNEADDSVEAKGEVSPQTDPENVG
ncbi:KAP family P-loop NTPase fold protein [Brevundimonas sp. SL161]|uniref:KAP family P-loop NTPase fold protein n=1 Tax=Brevundimonas sp. SL161 TaxID=2804613 RepID=UPI003CEB8621